MVPPRLNRNRYCYVQEQYHLFYANFHHFFRTGREAGGDSLGMEAETLKNLLKFIKIVCRNEELCVKSIKPLFPEAEQRGDDHTEGDSSVALQRW